MVLEEERFTPHKWLNYIKSLEERQDNCFIQEDEQLTYVKQSTGLSNGETKIGGLPWNKETNEVSIDFTNCINKSKKKQLMRRQMIAAINSVFHELGIILPLMITGKLPYNQACLKIMRWNEEVHK